MNITSNATHVEMKSLKALPLKLLRYGDYFNNISYEPYHVRMTRNGKLLSFIQILRLYFYYPNNEGKVYLVLSESEDNEKTFKSGFFLVEYTWHIAEDQRKRMNHEDADSCPSIDRRVLYYSKREFSDFIGKFEALDALLKAGFHLSKRNYEDEPYTYTDIGVCRRYSWGKIEKHWHMNVENIEAEQQMLDMKKLFDSLPAPRKTIEKAELDYIFPPELYYDHLN